MIWLIALLPLLFLYRFRKTPLDRDYAPYALPAVLGLPYLRQGHVDIKPPLIHWSYKVWQRCFSWLGLNQIAFLRLMPALAVGLSAAFLGNWRASLVLSLLLISPTLWTHMANTEWLTVAVLSFSAATATSEVFQTAAWFLLGLLPLANQKNALLLVPVIWALRLNPTLTNLLALCIPGTLCLLYLALTKRLPDFFAWCVAIPAQFGARRTFKANTLGHAKFLLPCIFLLAPFIACMDWHSRWTLVLVWMVAVTVWSKQTVPHHFILFTFPIAMAAQPGPMAFVAFFLVWAVRDGICWYKPELIYRVTFGGGQGDYGTMMNDARHIEAWLRENTAKDEVIWVNGAENQIYLNTLRKPWRIEIPEIKGLPDGEPPRCIVHCSQSAQEFDYAAYEPKLVSVIGLFTLMVRK